MGQTNKLSVTFPTSSPNTSTGGGGGGTVVVGLPADMGTPISGPWTNQDIGPVSIQGGAGQGRGGFAISDAGTDIWGTEDNFHYVWQTLNGDGQIIARVLSIENVNRWSKAGVMVRASLSPNSPHAMVVITPANGLATQGRVNYGQSSYNSNTGIPSLTNSGYPDLFGQYFLQGPTLARVLYDSATGQKTYIYNGDSVNHLPPSPTNVWLRLVRKGNNVSTYYSQNGVGWISTGTKGITLGQSVLIGLAVTSHDRSRSCVAQFDNVNVYTTLPSSGNPPSTPLNLLQNSNSDTQIGLIWQPSTDEVAVTAYNIYRNGVKVGTTTKSQWIDTGLTASTTYNYTVTALNAAQLESAQSTSLAAMTTVSQVLPQPWQHTDVGQVGFAGRATYTNGKFLVVGSGSDIWNSTDAFHYTFQTLNGDGLIMAKVENLDALSTIAKAGLMMRYSNSAFSQNAYLQLSTANGAVMQWRQVSGAKTFATVPNKIKAPLWLLLVKQGDNFIGYSSSDGSNWQSVGQIAIPMSSNVSVGLAVVSHDNSTSASGLFSNVQVINQSTESSGLPYWWELQYFGRTGLNASDLSPVGDGNTLLQEYQLGRNPVDYYQGQAANFSTQGTGDLTVETNSTLNQPLVVEISDANNNPLAGAPVTFTITQGKGQISADGTNWQTAPLTVKTSSNGHASVYFLAPAVSGPTVILAQASSGGQTGQATFSIQTVSDDLDKDSDRDTYPDIFEAAHGSDSNSANSKPVSDFIVDQKGSTAYRSIQAALNKVTQDYQIISVMPGVYYERLTTNGYTVLIRSTGGAAVTTIDAQVGECAVTVSNANVILDGFKITNGYGGAISVTNADVRVKNCIMSQNTSGYYGSTGTTATLNGGSLNLDNCSIYGNFDSPNYPAATLKALTGTMSLTNSIVWNGGNETSVVSGVSSLVANYCDLQTATVYPGQGNINTDPHLLSDGHLLLDSPCIGLGNTTLSFPRDIDGETRLTGQSTDIGADQYVDTQGEGIPDWWQMQFFNHLVHSSTLSPNGLTYLICYQNGIDPRSTYSYDSNGLLYSWEIKYFGHLGVDPQADPNGDGISNLLSSYLGIDPTAPYDPANPGSVLIPNPDSPDDHTPPTITLFAPSTAILTP